MFKKFIDGITNKLGIASDHIQTVIKENKQYLEAELSVVKESREGIEALKNYAQVETPSLEAAILSLAQMFEEIESTRKEKVDQLNEKFISPLQSLVESLKTLQKEVKEAENAKKELDKAESKLEKIEAKPEAKRKPGELDVAKRAVKNTTEKYEKEEAEAKSTTEEFNKKKSVEIQAILKDLVEIEKAYHDKILKLLGSVKQKAEAIKVEEEAVIPEDSEEE